MIPSTVAVSLWQTPHAWTRMRTSSRPGDGTARSSNRSFAPRFGTLIARIVAMANPPLLRGFSRRLAAKGQTSLDRLLGSVTVAAWGHHTCGRPELGGPQAFQLRIAESRGLRVSAPA